MRGRIKKVRTTDDRVELIAGNIQKGRISPLVHTHVAEALTDYCPDGWCIRPRDWLGEVNAIADHIQRNVRYTLDTYGIDTYSTPDRTLQLAKGDCDCMTALGGAMLQAAGHPIRIKVIQMDGQPDYHHIYLLSGIPPEEPTQWIPVDATQVPAVGAEPRGIANSLLYEVN